MAVNYRILRLEISKQADRVILPRIKPLLKQEFDTRKERMLEEFDQHGVTRELRAASNNPTVTSSYVHTAEGGNLFSLLGFEEGTDPTTAVRQVLDKDVRLNLSQTTKEMKTDTILFKAPVRIPNLDTINQKVAEEQSLQWTSRPFLDAIERGITGFGHYLYKATRRFKTSRSGPAIQIEGTLRQGSTPPIRYVSQIIADFKNSLKT